MGYNSPKRQHYIPKMLLKRFADADDLIWVNDGSNVFKTNYGNAFSIGHLYTRAKFGNTPKGASYDEFLSSVQKSYEHEESLGRIESDAEPAVQRIVETARQGKCPQLPPRLREAWKRFFVGMARRTPESQDRVAESAISMDAFYEAAKRVADQDDHPLPAIEELYQAPRVLELREMVMSNTNARFAAGDDPRLESETKRFIGDTGLCVLAVGIPNSGLVIGSHGLTVLDDELGAKLGALSWVPIADDLAVGATAYPDREFLTVLDSENEGEQIVSAFNAATAARSKYVAGSSESLVRSLL